MPPKLHYFLRMPGSVYPCKMYCVHCFWYFIDCTKDISYIHALYVVLKGQTVTRREVLEVKKYINSFCNMCSNFPKCKLDKIQGSVVLVICLPWEHQIKKHFVLMVSCQTNQSNVNLLVQYSEHTDVFLHILWY